MPRHARRVLPALVVVLVSGGCGSASHHARAPVASPAGPVIVRLKARLTAHGYTVQELGSEVRPAELGLYVPAVDWASPHSFDVSIFVFASAATARTEGSKLAGEGRFPETNRSKRVGRALFVASADVGGSQLCPPEGGVPRCPPIPRVPARDFSRLVAIAEGG